MVPAKGFEYLLFPESFAKALCEGLDSKWVRVYTLTDAAWCDEPAAADESVCEAF
jgi:hypothetical protein